MLKAKSRDGVYIISAPDTAKTGSSLIGPGEDEDTKFDKVQDVYLEVIEGKEANLDNLASAIAYDCLDSDGYDGLHLLAKKLICHVKAGDKEYEFTTLDYSSLDQFICDLATQIKL